VGDQDTGSPGRPVSSRLQVAVSRGIVVQEQDTLGELTAEFFLQNILQLLTLLGVILECKNFVRFSKRNHLLLNVRKVVLRRTVNINNLKIYESAEIFYIKYY